LQKFRDDQLKKVNVIASDNTETVADPRTEAWSGIEELEEDETDTRPSDSDLLEEVFNDEENEDSVEDHEDSDADDNEDKADNEEAESALVDGEQVKDLDIAQDEDMKRSDISSGNEANKESEELVRKINTALAYDSAETAAAGSALIAPELVDAVETLDIEETIIEDTPATGKTEEVVRAWES
jgi:hypothetical protein